VKLVRIGIELVFPLSVEKSVGPVFSLSFLASKRKEKKRPHEALASTCPRFANLHRRHDDRVRRGIYDGGLDISHLVSCLVVRNAVTGAFRGLECVRSWGGDTEYVPV
jgi:hypothetical protein